MSRPTSEICGDVPLSADDKIRYVTRNLARNIGIGRRGLRVRHYAEPRANANFPIASPGRVLTEAFLMRRLPMLLPLRRVDILEIGCGSGRLASMLAEIGYTGDYLGVDVTDRFDHRPVAGLTKTFLAADAQTLDASRSYDLIVSVSALEHIPNDADLVRRLPAMLSPRGVQLHFVPAGWGLPVYLWHGYRQYTLRAIAERFDRRDTVVYAMGGLCAFILHLTFITLPELVIGIGARRRFPDFYRSLTDFALRVDRFLPFCPTMYAIASGPGLVDGPEGPRSAANNSNQGPM